MHGIPWAYDNGMLSDLFTDYDPSFGIESAEVVYGKDGRSRVRTSVCLLCGMRYIPCPCCLCVLMPFASYWSYEMVVSNSKFFF